MNRIAFLPLAALLVWLMQTPSAMAVTLNMRMGTNVTAAPPGGNPLDPTFVAEMAPYRCIRFMDWQGTNANSSRVMSDEQCVNLCNANKSDGWFCVKHDADDNYIKGLAQLTLSKLDPKSKCYIEYSNETWNVGNPFYIQTYHCYNKALEKGIVPSGLDPQNKDHHVAIAAYYHAYRAVEIFKIFKSVYGDAMKSRVVKVVASQYSNTNLTGTIIDAMLDPKVNPDKVTADAFAIAPYFDNGEEPFTTIAGATTMAKTVRVGGHLKLVRENYNARAGANAVLVAYEGGQGFVRAQDQFARDPQSYNVYKEYLSTVAPFLDLFCHYTHTHGAGWSDYHSWGAKSAVGQPLSEAHKYRALVDWAKEHPYNPGVATRPELSRPALVRPLAMPTPGASFDLWGRKLVGLPSGSVLVSRQGATHLHLGGSMETKSE